MHTQSLSGFVIFLIIGIPMFVWGLVRMRKTLAQRKQSNKESQETKEA